MQSTNQLRIVSPLLSGVQCVGHQPLQQRHPQTKSRGQLGLHYWTQLTRVTSQHYLSRREQKKKLLLNQERSPNGGTKLYNSEDTSGMKRCILRPKCNQCVCVVLTSPSLSDTRLMGIRDSGSVAWPASSRNTWVKCPTLKKNNPNIVLSWVKNRRESVNRQTAKAYCSPILWNMPALEHVHTTILWKEAWRMSSPAFEYNLRSSGMD